MSLSDALIVGILLFAAGFIVGLLVSGEKENSYRHIRFSFGLDGNSDWEGASELIDQLLELRKDDKSKGEPN